MNIEKAKKPYQLRIIFILNALMMLLPFVFYYVFTTKNITIEGLDPVTIIYTGMAYIVSFGILVLSILKRNMVLFRIMFAVNVVIALPAKAYLGILIALISMLISFNAKVKGFFNSTGEIRM